jgi:hypothetical protein
LFVWLMFFNWVLFGVGGGGAPPQTLPFFFLTTAIPTELFLNSMENNQCQ